MPWPQIQVSIATMKGYYVKENNLATARKPVIGIDVYKEGWQVKAMSLGKFLVSSVGQFNPGTTYVP